MNEKDIFLVRAEGLSVFSVIADRLLAKGVIDHLVLALAVDVPQNIVKRLREDGFDVVVGTHASPQQRILDIMKHHRLAEALILNGYSFFLDADIIERISERRKTAGANIVAYVSKTPFRYACILDIEACRELCTPKNPPLPPNRLHCNNSLSGSCINTSIVRADEEFSPLDDCFWFLALGALHGRGDSILIKMIQTMSCDQNCPPSEALSVTLAKLDIHIPSLVAQYGGKSVHLYFKNRREVEFIWLSRLAGLQNIGDTFLEVGTGESPYLSQLFARHFTHGICFDPCHSTLDSQLFKNRLAIASELDKKLSPYISSPGGKGENLSVQYHQGDLLSLKLPSRSVDFCFSRSVLEHVVDLKSMAIELHRVMRPSGVMLHAVDFTAHDERQDDNIYPFYAHAKAWWLANKPRLINLMRLSDLIDIFAEAGFTTKVLHRNLDSRLPARLHHDWQGYHMQDLVCGGAFISNTTRK